MRNFPMNTLSLQFQNYIILEQLPNLLNHTIQISIYNTNRMKKYIYNI